jgi:hypothetical protein
MCGKIESCSANEGADYRRWAMKALVVKGGNLLAPPEGFVVLGVQGPLKDGELERAAGWAKGIVG